MAVQTIYGNSTVIQRALTQEKLPELHCSCCNRCSSDKRCDYFNRYVDSGYNRCFYHSYYVDTPNIHYVSPPDAFFKEIQAEEMRRIKSLQKNIGFA